jgi:hypothetical protein
MRRSNCLNELRCALPLERHDRSLCRETNESRRREPLRFRYRPDPLQESWIRQVNAVVDELVVAVRRHALP